MSGQQYAPHPGGAQAAVVVQDKALVTNPFGNAPVAAETRRDVALEQQTPQVMAVIAQNCPRDKRAICDDIIKICSIPSVADRGMYNYKRGGKPIAGLGIGVVESIATAWGNLTWGVSEVSRGAGFSSMMAWAWDMQTNGRRESTFIMPHERFSNSKGMTKLIDPRDIYENNTNFANRRMRKCLERLIGKEIMDLAEAQIIMTLSSNKNLQERISNLLQSFAKINVTEDMLVRKVGHKLTQMTGPEFADLRLIYNGITTNESEVDDWFEPEANPQKIKRLQTESAAASNDDRKDKLAAVAMEELQEAIRVAQELKWDIPKMLGKKNIEEILSAESHEVLNAYAQSINDKVTQHQTLATNLKGLVQAIHEEHGSTVAKMEKHIGFALTEINSKTTKELAVAFDKLQT